MTLKKEVDFSSFEPLADNNQFYLNGIEAENDGIYLAKYYLDNCLMYSDKTKPDKINPDEITKKVKDIDRLYHIREI